MSLAALMLASCGGGGGNGGGNGTPIGSAPTPTPTLGVTVSAESNFGGASLSLGVGDYPIGVIRSWPPGLGNDQISSIELAPGYIVTVCLAANLGPPGVTYTTSQASLGFLDNQISHIVVTAVP